MQMSKARSNVETRNCFYFNVKQNMTCLMVITNEPVELGVYNSVWRSYRNTNSV